MELLDARDAEHLAADREELVLQISRLSGTGPGMRPQDAEIIESERQAAAQRVKDAERRLLERHEAFFGAWRESGA